MNKSLDEKHKENAKKALAEAKARKKKEIAILRAKEKEDSQHSNEGGIDFL